VSGETERSLRREQIDQTRAALIEAARRLFARDGFADTSVDAIAAEAGVTKGAVYHHFSTKTAVFRSVYDTIEREVEIRCAHAAAGIDAPVEQLAAVIGAYLDAALESDVARITLIDAPSVLRSELSVIEPGPGHFAMRTYIAANIDAGAIARVDPDILTHVLRGAALQAATLVARSADPEEARARAAPVLHRLITGLRPA
jgi:AcrR family transcriptional regulator